jgi:hypothetical protein
MPCDSDGASRRRFLRASGMAIGGLLGGARLPDGVLRAQGPPLSPYLADINGDGVLARTDEDLVQAALYGNRGYDVRRRTGYDYRADVFGRGVVEPDALDSVRRAVSASGGPIAAASRRPVTIAWHYGWYNTLERPPGSQTVRYKGGDYFSFDPEIETEFNDLKNEFGITVDALSWIPGRANQDMIGNYRNGFLSADNVDTRQVALLYESTLALPVANGRVDFLGQPAQFYLREDFQQMGRFLVEIRDTSPARIFRLDGRPVVFIFGSHSWGDTGVDRGEFRALEYSLDTARQVFHDAFGEYPYIVGEEIFLSTTGRFSEDRRRRSNSFDAIYIYHHASNLKSTHLSPGIDPVLYLSPEYIDNQILILRRTYDAVETLRNRYTGAPVLVIPNLSPGFAKPGLPTLKMGRVDYAQFMQAIKTMHESEYLFPTWGDRLGTDVLPAPLYVVGSWNEEFEGHSVFPASLNLAFSDVTQSGFDWVMAIKELFGWNHYAGRSILP